METDRRSSSNKKRTNVSNAVSIMASNSCRSAVLMAGGSGKSRKFLPTQADILVSVLYLCVDPDPMNSGLRVRFHIIRNARIENLGKSQSCMVSKLRIIWKQTVRLAVARAVPVPLADDED